MQMTGNLHLQLDYSKPDILCEQMTDSLKKYFGKQISKPSETSDSCVKLEPVFRSEEAYFTRAKSRGQFSGQEIEEMRWRGHFNGRNNDAVIPRSCFCCRSTFHKLRDCSDKNQTPQTVKSQGDGKAEVLKAEDFEDTDTGYLTSSSLGGISEPEAVEPHEVFECSENFSDSRP